MPDENDASSRRSPLSGFILSLRILGALLVLVAMGFWGWQAFHWQDRLELVDTFGPNSPFRPFMLRDDGIYVEGEGLAVRGGEVAVRRYGVTRSEGHRLFLHVKAAEGAPARFGLWLSRGDVTVPLDTSLFDGRPIELTDHMPPGNAQLELWIENTAPEGSPPAVMLESLKVTRRETADPVHPGTLLFYGLTGGLFWLFIFSFAIPSGVEQLLGERAGLSTARRSVRAVLLLGAVIAAAWLLGQPEWDELKDYDDRAAIGNSAMLLDNGFDQSGVYFRSRVRPGFLGIAQPALALSPHRLSGYWSNASDNFRQDWLIYDQDGWPYGLFTYPHLTLMSQGLAIVLLLAFYGVYRRLDVMPALALGAVALATVYYGRSLTIAITQTVTLCVNVLVVWHYLAGGENPSWRHRTLTGLMLGLAFLVKETAATTVIALGLFTLLDGPPKEAGRRILFSLPTWGAALIWPVMYFGGVAEGGFREIFANFGNHLTQDELNPFEPLTLTSGFRDMTVVFSLLGLGAVAVGLAAASARRFESRADRFMLAWTVGCLPVFALPYIFPRFLMYFIPSFAWWSLRVLDFIGEKRGAGENA